ncbi:MAG: NUDIX hydrolase [Rhodospirillales bacterium]|nr:NUDIX hydrolase [Rhodospirillales bacterium]
MLINAGRVLLLLNARDEWDLPGGRPDPDEDHCAAVVREVREETGIVVEAGALLGEHLFEVLPQRFVRIVAYVCELQGDGQITLSHEHREARWVDLSGLGGRVAGYPLPAGYLGAIRQAIDQPLSPTERDV